MKRGLVLDKVVLLGRTLDEYRRFFALNLPELRGQAVLDVASGVSSFRAEAAREGLDVTALDPIYDLSVKEIEPRCAEDLNLVVEAVPNLKTYRWDFYKSPEYLRTFRERAYREFLRDYAGANRNRYVRGLLSELPFADAQFHLTLVSYFLFVYEDQFDYDFHKRSLLELMRVTCGEARIYPLVTFEAARSGYLDALRDDPELRHLKFEEVPTDFEFLVGSNSYLSITHR